MFVITVILVKHFKHVQNITHVTLVAFSHTCCILSHLSGFVTFVIFVTFVRYCHTCHLLSHLSCFVTLVTFCHNCHFLSHLSHFVTLVIFCQICHILPHLSCLVFLVKLLHPNKLHSTSGLVVGILIISSLYSLSTTPVAVYQPSANLYSQLSSVTFKVITYHHKCHKHDKCNSVTNVIVWQNSTIVKKCYKCDTMWKVWQNVTKCDKT